MIACLSPSDQYFEENISTLQYASRTNQISNIPTKNIDPKVIILNQQKLKIADLEKELRSATTHIFNLSQFQQENEQKIKKLTYNLTILQKRYELLSESHGVQRIQNETPSLYSDILNVEFE